MPMQLKVQNIFNLNSSCFEIYYKMNQKLNMILEGQVLINSTNHDGYNYVKFVSSVYHKKVTSFSPLSIKFRKYRVSKNMLQIAKDGDIFRDSFQFSIKILF